MSAQRLPSNLELQALSVLWSEGPSTVGTVLENIPDGRSRAYTTILSVLQGMEKKGYVKRKKSGKAHLYSASKSQSTVLGAVVKNFLRDNFHGSVGDAMLSLLKAGKLTADEQKEVLAEVKKAKTVAKRAKKASVPAKAKKATPKKAAKKVAKKAAKKSAKKAAKKKVAKKAVKKTAKKVVKKAAKKATKKTAKKAAKKATKRGKKK